MRLRSAHYNLAAPVGARRAVPGNRVGFSVYWGFLLLSLFAFSPFPFSP